MIQPLRKFAIAPMQRRITDADQTTGKAPGMQGMFGTTTRGQVGSKWPIWVLLRMVLLWCVFASAHAGTPMVSTGNSHTVLVSSDGQLFAAGDDRYGQLGRGTVMLSAKPLWVGAGYMMPSGQVGAVVSAGANHNVVIDKYGNLWAWGNNKFGQLGDGTTTNSTTPKFIGSGYSAVAAGDDHTIAVKGDGSLWTWGSNKAGQLGDGSNISSLTPHVVGDGFASVAAGATHSLALGLDGKLWAWGANSEGQLGNGATSNSTIPIVIGGGYRAMAASSSQTFAIKSDGNLWAWGANSGGQLGDGSTTGSTSPKWIGSGYRSVAAGTYTTVAVKSDGGLWSWGVEDPLYQLIFGTRLYSSPNSLVPKLIGSGFSSVAMGGDHIAALKSDGSLWTLGSNLYGQLGDESTTSTSVLKPIGGGFVAVSAGSQHTVALKSDGNLWAWGNNSLGQLGVGTSLASLVPQSIGSGYSSATAGSKHTVAVKGDSSLWAWGDNTDGQLGIEAKTSSATPQLVGTGYRSAAAGFVHTVAVKHDGSLWAWGNNGAGQLGVGTVQEVSTPLQIGTQFSSVAAGLLHNLAIKIDGSVWAWGANLQGQLGDVASTGSVWSMTQIDGLHDVVAVATGDYHSLALKRDGSVWAWGRNLGQLGDGTAVNRGTPVRVLNLDEVVSIAADGFTSLAVKQDGTVWLWGRTSYTPMRVNGLDSISAIVARGGHALFLKKDGSVGGWGTNTSGQLGDGTFAQRAISVLMLKPNADGFLSLQDDSAKLVPVALNVPFFVSASGVVSSTVASVRSTTYFNPSDTGKPGSVYVTAMVPSGSLGTTAIGTSPPKDIFASQPPQLTATPACPAAANPLTLIQLTPSGWQTVVNGQLIPYASGVLGDQLAAQTILNGTDTTNLKGAEFCVGYGTSAQDMVNNGNIRAVATIPGATTSSSCVVGGTISVGLSLAAGWNLLGNPVNQSLGVAQKFGDASKVNTVWKWDAIKANWQFYTPSLNATDLLAYATAQGYGVLSEIQAGDGYWVHAKTQADLGSLCGQAVNLRQSSLSSGWNLVSTASPISAKEFNLALSDTPPTTGQVPINMTSLWAWDTAASQWFFYAPVLDAQGASTLLDYIGAKSYKDFTGSGKTLGNGVGIWVNRL
jgi:alpha-tubulin suppressor-like RCC1 family protein